MMMRLPDQMWRYNMACAKVFFSVKVQSGTRKGGKRFSLKTENISSGIATFLKSQLLFHKDH